ncbi:hypothetical protein FRC12_024656 [Ceratobasidium sp. 428]|nr:hypothetical protein FRC12_024656 [Ceratobasidium sp. 428]
MHRIFSWILQAEQVRPWRRNCRLSQASSSNDPGDHSVENDRGRLLGKHHDGHDPSRLATERDVSGDEMGGEINKRRSHHHHGPDNTSKGGHPKHWYEHYYLDPNHPHRHSHEHHHRRVSGPWPRRLRGYTDEGGDTFIAPASVRVKTKHRSQSGPKKSLGTAPGKMVKKPKTTPTGLFRAVRLAETGTNPSVSSSGQVPRKSGGQVTSSSAARRDLVASNTTSSPPNRLASVVELSAGVVGLIDLIARVNGTIFGGLSVSRMPLPAFEVSSDNTSHVLDATPNPSEQTKFYMRRPKKQPTLISSSMPDTQDVLVSLQAQIPDPSKNKKPSAHPVVLANLGGDSGAVAKEDTVEVYVVAPPSEAKGVDRTASVVGAKYSASTNKSVDRMPVDASD